MNIDWISLIVTSLFRSALFSIQQTTLDLYFAQICSNYHITYSVPVVCWLENSANPLFTVPQQTSHLNMATLVT